MNMTRPSEPSDTDGLCRSDSAPLKKGVVETDDRASWYNQKIKDTSSVEILLLLLSFRLLNALTIRTFFQLVRKLEPDLGILRHQVRAMWPTDPSARKHALQLASLTRVLERLEIASLPSRWRAIQHALWTNLRASSTALILSKSSRGSSITSGSSRTIAMR